MSKIDIFPISQRIGLLATILSGIHLFFFDLPWWLFLSTVLLFLLALGLGVAAFFTPDS